MRSFHIIAGLPRAGSTLLCQILNSNPEFHVTPTSAVLDMLKTMRATFSSNMTFRAQNRMEIYENFKEGLKGFINGYFYDRQVVFDKNRAWTANINILDKILDNNETKIIWMYRDPVEIVSSIEAQYQKTILLENMDESGAPGAFMTLERRISLFTSQDGLIGSPIEALKDAIEMGYADRIFLVRYYDLTNNPKETLEGIHDFLGEKHYDYDFNNIKQSTWEFDGIYNYKFPHVIKEGQIKFKKADIQLEPKYVNAINERFSALNKLIFEGDASALLGVDQSQNVNSTKQETGSSGMSVSSNEDMNKPNQNMGLFDRLISDQDNF